MSYNYPDGVTDRHSYFNPGPDMIEKEASQIVEELRYIHYDDLISAIDDCTLTDSYDMMLNPPKTWEEFEQLIYDILNKS